MEATESTGHGGIETLVLRAGGLEFSALAMGEGPIALCLHGFPDHNRSFRHQLPALADSGYRAVAPMLRGYEPGSQPTRDIAAYHPLRVATDVADWARELGGGAPVHLIGHDWGAILAYLACGLEPTLFRSACAVAVPGLASLEAGIRAHPVQLRNSWYTLFFQLRFVADAVVRAWDFAFIERLWGDWSPGWEWSPSEMASLKETFRQPGVVHAALAYYRTMLNPFSADSRRMRGVIERPIRVPTLAVTGALDGCMDTRLFDAMQQEQFPAGLLVERIEEAGHFVHQERPDAFNALLLDWLETHRG